MLIDISKLLATNGGGDGGVACPTVEHGVRRRGRTRSTGATHVLRSGRRDRHICPRVDRQDGPSGGPAESGQRARRRAKFLFHWRIPLDNRRKLYGMPPSKATRLFGAV